MNVPVAGGQPPATFIVPLNVFAPEHRVATCAIVHTMWELGIRTVNSDDE